MFYKIGFCVYVVLTLTLQGFVFYFALSRVKQAENRFSIDKEFYSNAISNSVSSYLLAVIPPDAGGEDAKPVRSSVPRLAFVSDLSSWTDFSGRDYCMLDGVKYRLGDYTQYGRVVAVREGRVFCECDGEYVIVRRSASAVAPATAEADAGQGAL